MSVRITEQPMRATVTTPYEIAPTYVVVLLTLLLAIRKTSNPMKIKVQIAAPLNMPSTPKGRNPPVLNGVLVMGSKSMLGMLQFSG